MSSNLVRGWTSAALGAAWILVWGWLGTTARAEEFLNVYGVAVHLFATPNCKPPVSEWSVSVKVAPFEERANLSEVVSELARRSLDLGANTLHGIRILSAVPFRGTEAAGIASTCAASDGAPSGLLGDVAGSRTAEAHVFGASHKLGPERTIAGAEPKRIATLTEEKAAHLRRLIVQLQTYDVGPAIIGSCPFIPDLGFRLVGGAEVWWLVSFGRGCDAAVLIRRDGDWRRAKTVELTADAVARLRDLSR